MTNSLPIFCLLIVGILTSASPCPAQQTDDGKESAVALQIEQFGSKRPRAPKDWSKLQWAEKKEVLMGLYRPTEDEIALIERAMPDSPLAPVPENRRLLVFYRCQYPHASIATANAAYQRLGRAVGYEVVLSDDVNDISTEGLEKFDCLLLNNTTDFDVTVGESGRQAILDFVKSGKGLVGIHAAADSCKNWLEGKRLINGIFACHPWLPKGTWAFEIEDPSHPLNQPFEGKGFWARDEIYAYRVGSHKRKQSRVLVGLDMKQSHNLESKDLHPKQMKWVTKYEKNPVAWIHLFGKGRVFYSNFGHNNTTYWNPLVLKHYLAGIQYAMGDLEADAVPSSELRIIDLASAPDQKIASQTSTKESK